MGGTRTTPVYLAGGGGRRGRRHIGSLHRSLGLPSLLWVMLLGPLKTHLETNF